jgi:hypothetical protein
MPAYIDVTSRSRGGRFSMKVHGRRDLLPLVDNVLFKIAKWGLSFDDHFTYYIDYYCRHPQAPRQRAVFGRKMVTAQTSAQSRRCNSLKYK